MRIYSPWRVCEPSSAPGPSKIRSADPSDAEHGAVTAEFAVVLPGVTLVLALCLGAVATGAAQVRLRGLPPVPPHGETPKPASTLPSPKRTGMPP